MKQKWNKHAAYVQQRTIALLVVASEFSNYCNLLISTEQHHFWYTKSELLCLLTRIFLKVSCKDDRKLTANDAYNSYQLVFALCKRLLSTCPQRIV